MATLKALQAKRWWEEIKRICKTRRIMQPALPSRARWMSFQRNRSVKTVQPVSTSSSLYGRTERSIQTTGHADQRMAQRNLSIDDVDYVLLYGETWHKAGAVIIHLRLKDIPPGDLVHERYRKLVGTTVVMARDGERTVLTVYRNSNSGLRHIKRKPDYGW